jgi:hypothetical protein
MIVILCHPGDAAALWLDQTLQQLGVGGVEVVAVEQLVFSRRIVYRLTEAGDSGTIELSDGRLLRPERITGLVNRVQYLPTQHFAAAQPDDRAYAEAELSAFLLAWINGIAGRVVNPPLPFALGGATFQMPTVMQLASMAGLPTRPWRASASSVDGVAATVSPMQTVPPTYTVSSTQTLPPTHGALVFDGRLFGPLLPRDLQDGCRRLAALLGAPLLQVMLHHSPEHGWRFVNVSGAVDFRVGGRPLAAALAAALACEAA